MKKIKLILLILLLNATSLISQDINQFAGKYYTITDNAENKLWTSYPNLSNYLFGYSTLNSDKQQFMFIPTYPGSSDFVIANKETGKVLKMDLLGNIGFAQMKNISAAECFFNLSGTVNNYSFRSYERQSYFANLSTQTGAYGAKAIIMYPNNSTDRSKFKFTYKGIAPNYTGITIVKSNGSVAPEPPSPNGYSSYGIPENNCETFDARTLVPYTFVDDRTPSEQIKYSPYYIMEKYVGWKKIQDYEIPAGISWTQTTSITYGTTYLEKNQIQNTLGFQYTWDSKAGFDLKIVSASLGMNMQVNFKTVAAYSTQSSYEYSKTVTNQISKSETQRILILHYIYYERYKVYSLDDQINPILDYEVVPYKSGEGYWRMKSYPATNAKEISSSSVSSPSRLIEITSLAKSGTINNDNTNNNDYSFNCYPNPADNIVKIKYSGSNSCNLIIELLDLSGKYIEEVKRFAYTSGTKFITFDVNHLRNGTYFIRLTNHESKESKYKKIIINR